MTGIRPAAVGRTTARSAMQAGRLRWLPAAPAALALLLSGGCVSLGDRQLQRDQVDYSHALNDVQKKQTLSNMIMLRYAESPVFVPVTQIISAYTLNSSASASLNASTAEATGTTGEIGASVGYTNHPTFTFTPTRGEAFANGYIRPLPPALVLPLMQSGVPIDLLLRIAVQSIGSLQNSAALAGDNNSGSIGFFRLIHTLRRLQLKGALTVRFASDSGSGGGQVFLAINPSDMKDKQVVADAAEARKLLQIKADAKEVEVLYGALPQHGDKISMVTRSVIGILTELGAQIDVPEDDIRTRATLPTSHFLNVEPRPTIVVHVGPQAPPDAYADTIYRGQHYWIARDDFDSKFAFSVVQELIALAQVGQAGSAPVVTIPAG
jgi:hypothetical protein